MNKLLFLLPIALAACNDNIIVGSTDDDTPTDPLTHCDFTEYDQGLEAPLGTAQFIDTFPVPGERVVCGSFENQHTTPPMLLDYDAYLFPITSFEEYTEVNFDVECEDYHTPLLEVFFQNEETEEPVLIGSFVGAPGIVAVLDWPIGLTGKIKNDIFVRVSAYSTETHSNSDYVLKYW